VRLSSQTLSAPGEEPTMSDETPPVKTPQSRNQRPENSGFIPLPMRQPRLRGRKDLPAQPPNPDDAETSPN
jgi:hypothetical protein